MAVPRRTLSWDSRTEPQQAEHGGAALIPMRAAPSQSWPRGEAPGSLEAGAAGTREARGRECGLGYGGSSAGY